MLWLPAFLTIVGLSAPAAEKSGALDVAEYDRRLLRLAHVSTSTVSGVQTISRSTSTVTGAHHVPKATSPAKKRWPAKAPYPDAGAILPFQRVVAFYGNFYSKRMGVLGEYPEAEVLLRLTREVDRWKAADPETPVMPAIHYVAITAQGYAGADKKYRQRMPDKEVERALAMADKAHGIAFLDVQVALSTVQDEVPTLDKYLRLPNVHLGLDPEFSMKNGALPGKKIGTMDAAEINWAIRHLSELVRKNDLPPKILVIHRFIPQMVTSMRQIKPTPQVQVVIDMDGWGTPDDKRTAYRLCVTRSPVQFTGLKLFYKNDLRKPNSRHLTPAEVLTFTPSPIYIQYQ